MYKLVDEVRSQLAEQVPRWKLSRWSSGQLVSVMSSYVCGTDCLGPEPSLLLCLGTCSRWVGSQVKCVCRNEHTDKVLKQIYCSGRYSGLLRWDNISPRRADSLIIVHTLYSCRSPPCPGRGRSGLQRARGNNAPS